MAQLYLNGFAKDSSNFFFGVTSNYGPPYLIKVTNNQEFRIFAQKIILMEKNSKKRLRFTNQFENRFNTEDTYKNEFEFLKMLKKMNAINGISLYSGNAEANNWSQLSLVNNDIVIKKCF